MKAIRPVWKLLANTWFDQRIKGRPKNSNDLAQNNLMDAQRRTRYNHILTRIFKWLVVQSRTPLRYMSINIHLWCGCQEYFAVNLLGHHGWCPFPQSPLLVALGYHVGQYHPALDTVAQARRQARPTATKHRLQHHSFGLAVQNIECMPCRSCHYSWYVRVCTTWLSQRLRAAPQEKHRRGAHPILCICSVGSINVPSDMVLETPNVNT